MHKWKGSTRRKPSTTQRRWGTTVHSSVKYMEPALCLSAIFGVLSHKFLIRTYRDSPEFVLHLCPPVCAKGILPAIATLHLSLGFWSSSPLANGTKTCLVQQKGLRLGCHTRVQLQNSPSCAHPVDAQLSTGNSGLWEPSAFLGLLQRSLWPHPFIQRQSGESTEVLGFINAFPRVFSGVVD